jgi:Tol biopolymer transport system component
MKPKNLIIGLFCLFGLVVVFSITTKSQKPEDQPKFERIEIGTGGPPHWSPDGGKLAFISGGWLCVRRSDGKGEIKRVAETQPDFFEWMSDSEFVVYEREYPKAERIAVMPRLSIKRITIDGQVTNVVKDTTFSKTSPPKITKPMVLPDGTVGYYECEGGFKDWGCNVFKIIKQGKLSPDSAKKQWRCVITPYPTGDISVESIDHTVKKKVTSGKQKYSFPRLSPDNTKILAEVASYTSDIAILDLQGNQLCRLDVGAKHISPGLFTVASSVNASWAPDSKKILYHLSTEDGHEVYDLDIYIVNADGTGKIQIAATPNEKEGGASWSPNGRKIAYVNGTTGKIYVVKVK